jgi:hypothetical protein
MEGGGYGSVGRLLARARRPAVRPWTPPAVSGWEERDAPGLDPPGAARREEPPRSGDAHAPTARPPTREPGEPTAPSQAPGAPLRLTPSRPAPVPRAAEEPGPVEARGARTPTPAAPPRPQPTASAGPASPASPAGDGRGLHAPPPPPPPSFPSRDDPPREDLPARPVLASTPAPVTDSREELAPEPGELERPAARAARAETAAVLAPLRPATRRSLEPPAPPAPEPHAGAPGLRPAADSSAPTVVIDEIRIVTPPAPAPPGDPLASLAARRAGVSRHRGGARWRA